MFPNRNINDVSSTAGENRPMFLRQLIPVSSSFLLCRSSSASSCHLPHHSPSSPPWWWMRGPPPRPPGLPPCHPAARRGSFGIGPRPRGVDPGSVSFSGGWRWFSSTAGLMTERHRGDGAPPHKRRKSPEERDRRGEGGRAGGGAACPEAPRPNHRFKDGSRDRGKSREDDEKRTNDKTPHRGRETRPHGAASSRTQTPKPGPERGPDPERRPNAWFPEGTPEGRSRDRRRDGAPWSEILPEPRRSDPRQRAGAAAGGQRPPPGAGPPAPVEEDGRAEKSLQRQWEVNPNRSSASRPPGGGAAFDFSVMSYNILSQELLQDNVYLYRHCHPGVLAWSHRLPNLLAEIQQHDADILCLQEVQEDHYEDQIKPALQALGYQCEFKKRTGSKPDGCAVVFKTSRLSLLSSNPVEYFRPGDALLDRDNVALVLLLRPVAAAGSDPSAFICVANTHLLYNPRRGDIKLAQLAILLAEIGRLSRPPDGAANPVVLCGDFNSTPPSPLYHFLTTGRLEYRGLQSSMVSGQEGSPRGQRVLSSPLWSHSLGISPQCQYENKEPAETSSSPTEGEISKLTVEDLATKAAFAVAAASDRTRIEHSLKLRSTYQHRLHPDGRPEITTCHSRTAMTVDYILYTPDFPAPPSLPGGRGLQLLGRLSLVGQPEMEEVDGLPNRYHSSDHLPLLARFRLRL
ncbi:protein angel homolog 2 isoform X2 [Clinocottus analis]|uniref:protein angel homolog 2 isoform X2 n=1 Tax=Clinocottus analis TaxID=304258 RepID=UPI0035C1C30B